MAKSTLNEQGQIFQVIGGMDESVSMAVADPVHASVEGIFPFFYGTHQRIFGKKIIDFNPEQQIWGVHQTFNGVCLYGYYVETNNKLYFHVCNAPPDLRIKFYHP
jgi:hypothetical protein